jgi:site-specific DNA-cytosine methylase
VCAYPDDEQCEPQKARAGTTFWDFHGRDDLQAHEASIQRAEVRFDNVAGCLRTPGGGSSRQLLIFVSGNNIKSRLLSPRETARLMGLPDTYRLPENNYDAYHLTGDGVAVPVVRFLASELFEKILVPELKGPAQGTVPEGLVNERHELTEVGAE